MLRNNSRSTTDDYACTKTSEKNSKDSNPSSPTSGGIFDLDTKEKEIAELEVRTHEPAFWNDNVSAQKTMQQINQRKLWVDEWTKVHLKLADGSTLLDLAAESADESLSAELQAEAEAIEKAAADLEFRSMLSGVDDEK